MFARLIFLLILQLSKLVIGKRSLSSANIILELKLGIHRLVYGFPNPISMTGIDVNTISMPSSVLLMLIAATIGLSLFMTNNFVSSTLAATNGNGLQEQAQ